MANHPKPSRTYWYSSDRGFANEYTIGIATTQEDAEQYDEQGYERIDRDRALRELSYRGDNATQVYADVSVNGRRGYDRFEVARALRKGEPLPRAYC